MASNGGPKTAAKAATKVATKPQRKISAGLLFTDGKTILGGYQPHRRCIYGFGGKHERQESPPQTAIRETLEEIYGLHDIESQWVQDLMEILGPITEHESATAAYIFYLVHYKDLLVLMKYMAEQLTTKGIQSPYYDKLPRTMAELLNRKMVAHAEVQDIIVLELKDYEHLYKIWKKNRPKVIKGPKPKELPICDFFISDMKWVFNYFQEHPLSHPPAASAGAP